MKKLFYIEKILLLVVLLLIQSCSVLKDKYEFGHDAISFLYVNNTNSNEYKIITLYSLQTGETTDDFVYIDEKDSFIQPTPEGRLCIPCQERVNFTRQLMLGVSEEENENIVLQCGRKYKCYLKDCYPIMMQGEKFVVKNSTLLDISTGELYIKEQ